MSEETSEKCPKKHLSNVGVTRYVRSFRFSGGTYLGFCGGSLVGGCHLTGSTLRRLPVKAFTHPMLVRLQLNGSRYSPFASETRSETSSSAGHVSMGCQSGEPSLCLVMPRQRTSPQDCSARPHT